jgi:hypothetical protein
MKKIIIAIWSICLLSSCSDIFQKSITNSSIIIYTPADSLSSKVYTHKFYWESVSGATNYRLQIASPSFTSGQIQSIILDTTMISNKLTFTLNPGKYEWRLRAQNGGSETSYITRKLEIIQTSFDQRPMTVLSPSISTTVYSNSVLYNWTPISGTANYYIEIDTLGDGFSNPVIKKVDGTQNSFPYILQYRGIHNWRMYAVDSFAQKSQYSHISEPINLGTITFGMDTVSLVSPANNATLSPISAQYQFSWSEPKGAIKGETLTYTLTLFSSLNPANSITTPPYIVNYSAKAPASGQPQTATISGLTPGTTYYWSVMTTDANGVKSAYPIKRKFTAG